MLFPGGLLLPGALTLGAIGGRTCTGVIQNGKVVPETCTGPSALSTIARMVLLTILVLVPIATAIVLGRRMRARTAPA